MASFATTGARSSSPDDEEENNDEQDDDDCSASDVHTCPFSISPLSRPLQLFVAPLARDGFERDYLVSSWTELERPSGSTTCRSNE